MTSRLLEGVARGIVGVLLTLAVPACAQEPAPVVAEAERLVETIEAKGATGEAGVAARKLADIARRLDAHLERRPRDARALVARARVLTWQYRSADFVPTGVVVREGEDPRDRIVGLIARSLAVDSTGSSLFLLKSEILNDPMMFFATGQAIVFPPRPGDALPALRSAMRRAPQDSLVLARLERALLAGGLDLEAEALRAGPAANAESPVARQQARWRQVPIPSTLTEDPASRLGRAPQIHRHVQDPTAASRYSRVRIHQGWMSADTLIAAFDRRWPGLDWKDLRSDRPFPALFNPATRYTRTALVHDATGAWTPLRGWTEEDLETRTDVLEVAIEETDPGVYREALPDSLWKRASSAFGPDGNQPRLFLLLVDHTEVP